ncbi:MAG: hypothetical protein WCJ26_11910 [bacterium]
MGFEDFFGHESHDKYNRHHQQQRYESGYYPRGSHITEHEHHQHHGSSDHGYYPRQNIGFILMNLRNNPKLRMLVTAAGIVIFLILLLLVIVMMPLIIKMIGFIEKEGIQGISDWVTSFLGKLWQGSGK